MPALKNAKHEAFAQAYALSSNASEAWRKATSKTANADVNGARWLVIRGIVERVAELRKKADAASENFTVLSIAEKRDFIARLVKAKVSELDDDSDLWNGIKLTEQGREYKLPDKLRAIQIDNDLAVDGAEAGANKAMEIVIRKL